MAKTENIFGELGGAKTTYYAEGTVSISTTARTPITTYDVDTGVAFKPKTIIYNTKTAGITYYVSVIWDADATELPSTSNKQVDITNNNTTTHQTNSIPYTSDPRGFLYTVDDYGFTVDKTTSGYGNTCTYKAWG